MNVFVLIYFPKTQKYLAVPHSLQVLNLPFIDVFWFYIEVTLSSELQVGKVTTWVTAVHALFDISSKSLPVYKYI